MYSQKLMDEFSGPAGPSSSCLGNTKIEKWMSSPEFWIRYLDDFDVGAFPKTIVPQIKTDM